MSYRLSDVPDRIPASAPAHRLTHLQRGNRLTDASGELATSSRRSRSVGVIVLVAVIILIGWLLASPVQADETGTVPSTYQEEYKDWAFKWAKIAKRERGKLVKVTNALGLKKPRPLPIPAQYRAIQVDVTTGVEVIVVQWKDFGQKAKDTSRWYATRRAHLWQRMVKPGGAGVQRWAPLLRYCGLPESWMWRSLTIMRGESNGNPTCVYAGHYGLFQFTASWWAGKWDWRSPYHQCRAFVKAVKAGGWGHWAATDPGR